MDVIIFHLYFAGQCGYDVDKVLISVNVLLSLSSELRW